MYFSHDTGMTTTINEAKKFGICLQKPSKSAYSTMATRLKSYEFWLKKSPKPIDLANAGFFCTGKADIVECFYCGLKLENWDISDNPWVEHARHGSDCPFVVNVKGKDFIKRFNEIECDGVWAMQSTSYQQQLYTDDLIFTTAAQALLTMNIYNEQQIRNAIRKYVEDKGNLNFHAVDIASVIAKSEKI